MRTSNKVIAFAVALSASAASVPHAQAGWFWPVIAGTAGRVAAANAARVAAVAAVSGAVAGYAASAAAKEDEPAAAEQKYCLKGQQVYFVPRWATCCLDGTVPKTAVTEVTDLNKTLGK